MTHRWLPALAILVLVVSSLGNALAAGAREPYDCNLLLSIFYESLDSLVSMRPNTTLMKLALAMPVPESAEYLHHRVYSLLLSVASIEETVKHYEETGEPIPRSQYLGLLTRLYTAINSLESSIDSYTDILLRCAHGKTFATIISIQINLLKKRVPGLLYSLEGKVLSLAYRGVASPNATARLEPARIGSVNPRTTLCIESPIARDGLYRVETITIMGHSPGNTRLSYAEAEARNHTICIHLRIPVDEAKPPLITFLQRWVSIPVWFIVKAVGNGSVIGPLLVKSYLVYPSPVERIKIPGVVEYGNNITIGIWPRVPVNVTVAIGARQVRATLSEAANITIPSLGMEVGYHTVKVDIVPLVNATRYPRVSYSAALAIEAKPPRVRIEVDNPTISFTNVIKLSVINLGEEPVRVKTRLGLTSIDDIVLHNITFNLYAPPNPLPWIYRINVTVAAVNSTAGISYEEQVLLINPLGIVLVAALAALLAIARDELDLARLVHVAGPAIRRTAAKRLEAVEAYYEALRIRIRRSRLAALYYSMLKRLGVPPPRPPETLREHWGRVVSGLDKDGRLREAMLRAEEDLYSPRKTGGEKQG